MVASCVEAETPKMAYQVAEANRQNGNSTRRRGKNMLNSMEIVFFRRFAQKIHFSHRVTLRGRGESESDDLDQFRLKANRIKEKWSRIRMIANCAGLTVDNALAQVCGEIFIPKKELSASLAFTLLHFPSFSDNFLLISQTASAFFFLFSLSSPWPVYFCSDSQLNFSQGKIYKKNPTKEKNIRRGKSRMETK